MAGIAICFYKRWHTTTYATSFSAELGRTCKILIWMNSCLLHRNSHSNRTLAHERNCRIIKDNLVEIAGAFAVIMIWFPVNTPKFAEAVLSTEACITICDVIFQRIHSWSRNSSLKSWKPASLMGDSSGNAKRRPFHDQLNCLLNKHWNRSEAIITADW